MVGARIGQGPRRHDQKSRKRGPARRRDLRRRNHREADAAGSGVSPQRSRCPRTTRGISPGGLVVRGGGGARPQFSEPRPGWTGASRRAVRQNRRQRHAVARLVGGAARVWSQPVCRAHRRPVADRGRSADAARNAEGEYRGRRHGDALGSHQFSRPGVSGRHEAASVSALFIFRLALLGRAASGGTETERRSGGLQGQDCVRRGHRCRLVRCLRNAIRRRTHARHSDPCVGRRRFPVEPFHAARVARRTIRAGCRARASRRPDLGAATGVVGRCRCSPRSLPALHSSPRGSSPPATGST